MNARNKFLLALLATTPCAFAHAETEQRDVSGFTGVDAGGGIDIVTEVRGDTLYIEVDRDVEDESGSSDITGH